MEGLFQKFIVIDPRTSDVISSTEMVFTLRPRTDKHAIAALLAYAESVESENPQLADELRERVANEDSSPLPRIGYRREGY